QTRPSGSVSRQVGGPRVHHAGEGVSVSYLFGGLSSRFIGRERLRFVALLALALAAVALAAVAAVPAAAKLSGPSGRIAFARVVNAETGDSITYTANPDGSNVQQLFSADYSGNPRWSPDGSRVAILSAAGLPCCTVAAVIVNPDDGSYRVL